MRLIGTLTSPYARKARLVLLEKGIPHEFVIDLPQGSLALQANPMGRIPALVLDDGFCVFDSAVIADYADTLNDDPVLIPRQDSRARLRVKRWEALADGIVDSAVVVRTERMRDGDKQDAATLELHNRAISNALDHASSLLGKSEWCEGESITLADLALTSALIYLDLRQPERDWRGAYPDLASWFAKMGRRESVIAAGS